MVPAGGTTPKGLRKRAEKVSVRGHLGNALFLGAVEG